MILVIGMLALMMTLGVAFSIFMRSERAAAGNFRTDVQNRELLQVALSRAIDDIEVSIGTNAYPSWDILQSEGAGDVNANAIAGNSISNWIPWAVLESVAPAPRWVDPDSKQSGRISWLVLNCSGLLDVNYAGGEERESGKNVSEIQIAELPEVANAVALVANRPYETIQELGVKAGPALSSLPQNLVTYSAFPTNYPGGADLGLVDIGGDVSSLKGNRAAIVNALTQSGISDVAFVYSNLLYYVDSSPVPMSPDDLGSPLTKSVPMINEVRVTNSVIMVAGKCTTLVQVDVEWFYPFVKPTADAFSIVCDVKVEGAPPTQAQYVPPAIVGKSTLWTYAGQAGPLYGTVRFATANPPVAFATNDTVQLEFKVGVKVVRGGAIVDSVPYPYNEDSYLAMSGLKMTLPVSLSGGQKGVECIDPRFNWDARPVGGQWVPYTPMNAGGTLQQPNWITKRLFPNQYLGMYVAGEPLQNVGELAYLLRGSKASDKWSSIRVFTNGPVDRVLDHFMIQVSPKRRGFVNVNSRSPDVLGTVFSGLLLEAYPGQAKVTSVPVVSPDQVDSLATALMNQSQMPISRMSDYGTNTALISIVNSSGALTPFQEQAVLRESAGLLHFRQNYFIVLLYAKPSRFGGANTGLRAVAEIWRDPVANDSGQCPRFVRSFQILNN